MTCHQPFYGDAWVDFVQTWYVGCTWWVTDAHHFFPDLIKNGWRPFCLCTFGVFFNTTCIKVVAEKKHDNIHVPVKFLFDPVIFGRFGVYFSNKNDPKSHF